MAPVATSVQLLPLSNCVQKGSCVMTHANTPYPTALQTATLATTRRLLPRYSVSVPNVASSISYASVSWQSLGINAVRVLQKNPDVTRRQTHFHRNQSVLHLPLLQAQRRLLLQLLAQQLTLLWCLLWHLQLTLVLPLWCRLQLQCHLWWCLRLKALVQPQR